MNDLYDLPLKMPSSWYHLCDRKEPLPETVEERKTYNEIVKVEFNNKYRNPGGFSSMYQGFNFNQQKQRFEKTLEVDPVLKKVVDHQSRVEIIINDIRSHFGYMDSLKTEYFVYDENHRKLKELDKLIDESRGIENNLFSKMMLNIPIDLDRYILTEGALLEFTHVSEVVEFVGYLQDVLEQVINNSLSNGKEHENEALGTLQTIYTKEQLSKLYKALLAGNYICLISENDFIYLFSGRPLQVKAKIYWKKSKGMAVYLLDKICLNFSFRAINNCIETKYEKFDSNDRKKGYEEIDRIVEAIAL